MRSTPRQPNQTELERAQQRLVEIRAKYTRPDQQQYLQLLVEAWRYHIEVLRQQDDDRQWIKL